MKKTPIFPYPGSTWGKFKKIEHLLTPTDGYIETHCGSASTYMRLSWQPRLVILNDLNPDIVNLFNCIIQHPNELEDMLRFTLWSKETVGIAQDMLENSDSKFNRAWATLVMFNMTRYPFRDKPSFRQQHLISNDGKGKSGSHALKFSQWLENIRPYGEKLRKAYVTNGYAKQIFQKCDHPGNQFFVDPPFMTSHRACKAHYAFEDGQDNELMHIELLDDILHTKRSKVVILGYDTELYNDLLTAEAGWSKHTYKVLTDGSPKNECAWAREGANVEF